jgi:hypothetical protein
MGTMEALLTAAFVVFVVFSVLVVLWVVIRIFSIIVKGIEHSIADKKGGA